MDPKVAEYLVDIVRRAQELFEQVEHEIDASPGRAILRLRAEYRGRRVFVIELISAKRRKYSYYILQSNRVEAGFDNSPDPRAIRLKYGKIGRQHAGESIPHLHLEDKKQLTLTDEMTFERFLAWVEEHIL
ncbi:MAG: hypothetical protein GXP42_03585 [Chloroflexi bacterium]|nr:hypothetical protein [Chloroflexota bacterium]